VTDVFDSRLAGELEAFLAFKRARGYKYVRAEYMLRSFDRFVASIAKRQTLDQTMLAWLGRRPKRKAISVSMELSVTREFWRYLHRRDPRRFAREPRWPRLPSEPRFIPYVLSRADIRQLLRLCTELGRPRFRSSLYRALLLVLYCTGLRFGEALRLRVRDVDVRRHVLFVSESKGRSRWVPFRKSLGAELVRYLRARRQFVGHRALLDDLAARRWQTRA